MRALRGKRRGFVVFFQGRKREMETFRLPGLTGRYRGRRGAELRRVRDEMERDALATTSRLVGFLIKGREYARDHEKEFDLVGEADRWLRRYVPNESIQTAIRRRAALVFPALKKEDDHD
jgi:hypothetical protein